jgi:hypothetical protein
MSEFNDKCRAGVFNVWKSKVGGAKISVQAVVKTTGMAIDADMLGLYLNISNDRKATWIYDRYGLTVTFGLFLVKLVNGATFQAIDADSALRMKAEIDRFMHDQRICRQTSQKRLIREQADLIRDLQKRLAALEARDIERNLRGEE